FDGLTVDGDLHFGFDENNRRTTVHGETRFPGSHIRGQGVFLCAELSGKASFTQCWIEQEALFGAVSFGDDVSFEGAQFDDLAYFRRREDERAHAQFRGQAKFDCAVFSMKADFSSVEFEKTVSFDSTHFSSEANFRRASFRGEASFLAMRADADVYFQEAVFAAV